MAATKTIGQILRDLRVSRGLLLREVGAQLSLDSTILSKIERGDRMPTKEQVKALSEFYEEQKNDVIIAWLSDKLAYEVRDENLALEAMKVAEEKVGYVLSPKMSLSHIIKSIASILKTDGRVTTAWLYGSVAREEDTPGSDVDLLVELNRKRKYSMFDLIDIAHKIEVKLKRKIDLVEKGQLKDFAEESASEDMIRIYG